MVSTEQYADGKEGAGRLLRAFVFACNCAGRLKFISAARGEIDFLI
jgi:hypothetical protein